MADLRCNTPGNPSLQKGAPIVFSYNGKAMQGLQGDTIASALYANGRRIFSRSFKYHRPRGLYCMSGRCPNCLMTVDGVPNIRTCATSLKEGMDVRSQNAWPSLEFDALATAGLMDKQLEVGFYYKKFYSKPLDWMTVRKGIRKVAGLAPLPVDAPHHRHDKIVMHADVGVVGAGPSGLSAALEAAKAGLRVIVVDDFANPGGRLNYSLLPVIDGVSGPQLATNLLEELRQQPYVDILTEAVAFGSYEDNLIGVQWNGNLVKLRCKQLILATGCHEKQELFDNNDRPGIMLGRAGLKLQNLYGLSPGKKIVLYSSHDDGWKTAAELIDAGANIAAIVEKRASAGKDADPYLARCQSTGIPLYWSSSITESLGASELGGIVIKSSTGSESRVNCDCLLLGTGYQGFNGLLFQSGCSMKWNSELEDFLPDTLPSGVWVAGEVTGGHSIAHSLKSGELAGSLAVAAIDPSKADPANIGKLTTEVRKLAEAELAGTLQSFVLSEVSRYKKRVVCMCEDVTVKDLKQSIAEGYDNIETLKRFSTLSMGPCQGKMCSLAGLNVLSQVIDESPAVLGTTTSRPPVRPVSFSVLSGRHYHPYRKTPMHSRHEMLGAKWMDAGLWKRPEHYGDVSAEYRAVREAVGLIDVSTLGKFQLTGQGAIDFMGFIYSGDFSSLKTGRTRYGIICTEAGVLLDDGTIGRLGDNEFFITATTGNTEAVDQWFEWWLESSDFGDVQLSNVSSQYAAVNLAGPLSRKVLQPLTETDLSKDAFPYLGIKKATVAGVPAVLLRLGFVGELSYEIHVPWQYGPYLWEVLMDEGSSHGIRAFGVEAQRILRLEKKHLLPGVDTDALSNPIEAGTAWAVKMEKSDFVGKYALSAIDSGDKRYALVGFETLNTQAVAEEGSQVLVDGKSKGRITSARFSPGLGKSIGMAWIPADLASEGQQITLQNGENGSLEAMVRLKAFYDPEGERLRM